MAVRKPTQFSERRRLCERGGSLPRIGIMKLTPIVFAIAACCAAIAMALTAPAHAALSAAS